MNYRMSRLFLTIIPYPLFISLQFTLSKKQMYFLKVLFKTVIEYGVVDVELLDDY